MFACHKISAHIDVAYLSYSLQAGGITLSTVPPSVFCLPGGAACQGRPSAAQTHPAWTYDAPDRQPQLASVTKHFVEFVFNEALLCIHSISRTNSHMVVIAECASPLC